MFVLSTDDPSWLDLAFILGLLLIRFVAFPALVQRWAARKPNRRAETPEWLAPLIAAMVATAVIIRAWDADLGRPALGALLAGCLGVVGAMWWMSRRW